MHDKKLDKLVVELENYLGCWKQFNDFVTLARNKKFTDEDEAQFLEVKSVLIQELELITASVECTSPSREDVHSMVNAAPSLRYLSESNEGALRGVENHWHKIYLGFQAILGQLKVKQRDLEDQSFLGNLLKKKK